MVIKFLVGFIWFVLLVVDKKATGERYPVNLCHAVGWGRQFPLAWKRFTKPIIHLRILEKQILQGYFGSSLRPLVAPQIDLVSIAMIPERILENYSERMLLRTGLRPEFFQQRPELVVFHISEQVDLVEMLPHGIADENLSDNTLADGSRVSEAVIQPDLRNRLPSGALVYNVAVGFMIDGNRNAFRYFRIPSLRIQIISGIHFDANANALAFTYDRSSLAQYIRKNNLQDELTMAVYSQNDELAEHIRHQIRALEREDEMDLPAYLVEWIFNMRNQDQQIRAQLEQRNAGNANVNANEPPVVRNRLRRRLRIIRDQLRGLTQCVACGAAQFNGVDDHMADDDEFLANLNLQGASSESSTDEDTIIDDTDGYVEYIELSRFHKEHGSQEVMQECPICLEPLNECLECEDDIAEMDMSQLSNRFSRLSLDNHQSSNDENQIYAVDENASVGSASNPFTRYSYRCRLARTSCHQLDTEHGRRMFHHFAHEECMRKWLERKRECPVCTSLIRQVSS